MREVQAHQGTLFLDEIGDIPPDLQPKLLRVLQGQAFEPLSRTAPWRAWAYSVGRCSSASSS